MSGPAPRASAMRARLARLPWWEIGAVLGAYLLLAVVLSWPLVTDFATLITGGGSAGDQSGYLWDFWNVSQNGLSLWGTEVQHVINAPFGRESPGSVNVTLLATLGPAWVVASIWSPIVAYNVTVLSALTLSAAAMYLLARWVGAGRAVAGWSGVAFMIFPYELLRAQAHVPLAHIWCLPIAVLVGLRWIERPTGRRALWMVAGLWACWLTNPYYGTMGLVILGVCGVVGTVRLLRADGARRALVAAGQAVGAVAGLLAVPLALLYTAASGSIDQSLRRDPVELVAYGARLTDFLIPAHDNSFFAGLFGAERWADIASPGGERTAFVGYVTIVLAAVAAGMVLGGRRSGTPRQRMAVITAIPLLVTLLMFSAVSPVTVFGHGIDMPSSYLFDALPYLRVYARFAAAVMVVMLLLAVVGLTLLMRGRDTNTRVALVAGAVVLSALELPHGAPVSRIIHTDVPLRVEGLEARDVPTWNWLAARHDDAIVLETPATTNEAVQRYYMYGETRHGHRITNGIAPGQLGEDLLLANRDLTWPGVPERLAGLGVRLVTMNPWAYRMLGTESPFAADRPPAGLRVLATFPNGSAVWGLVARPDAAVAVPRQATWWEPEVADGAVWRWMPERSRVTVYAPRAGRYVVRFRARAAGGAEGVRQRLHLTGVDVADITVGRERAVAVPVTLRAGTQDVWLEARGPGTRAPAPGDPRQVTVQISDWVIEATT